MISNYSEYSKLRNYDYTINDLKDIYKKFKIKWKQKLKKDIIEDCYSNLKQHFYASKIQRFLLNQFIFNKKHFSYFYLRYFKLMPRCFKNIIHEI